MKPLNSCNQLTEDTLISIINNRTLEILNTMNTHNVTYKGGSIGSYSLTVRLQNETLKRILNNETTE